MEDTTLKKKDIEELEKLVKIAEEQGNNINLNLVYMIIDSEKINFAEVMKYFENRGITMIEGDVEPDITAYSCEGERIRPFDPSKISITMKPMTLDALIKRIQNEEIEFDTSFQRKAGLWSKRQKSQLLESIFLRIPLPAFYFDATDEDEWLIIDGLQRVSTLKEFVVDKSLKLEVPQSHCKQSQKVRFHISSDTDRPFSPVSRSHPSDAVFRFLPDCPALQRHPPCTDAD